MSGFEGAITAALIGGAIYALLRIVKWLRRQKKGGF